MGLYAKTGCNQKRSFQVLQSLINPLEKGNFDNKLHADPHSILGDEEKNSAISISDSEAFASKLLVDLEDMFPWY